MYNLNDQDLIIPNYIILCMISLERILVILNQICSKDTLIIALQNIKNNYLFVNKFYW